MLWLPELPTFKPLSDMSRKFEHRPHDWSQARRCMVARRRIEETDPQPTLFTLERYAYRAWQPNLALTPEAVWHFYDGRAGMERRIRESRRIMHWGRFPRVRLRPMPSIWK